MASTTSSNIPQIDIAEITSSTEWLALIAQAAETTLNGLVISSALQPGFPIVYASEAFCNFTGYSTAEILGRTAVFYRAPTQTP